MCWHIILSVQECDRNHQNCCKTLVLQHQCRHYYKHSIVCYEKAVVLRWIVWCHNCLYDVFRHPHHEWHYQNATIEISCNSNSAICDEWPLLHRWLFLPFPSLLHYWVYTSVCLDVGKMRCWACCLATATNFVHVLYEISAIFSAIFEQYFRLGCLWRVSHNHLKSLVDVCYLIYLYR